MAIHAGQVSVGTTPTLVYETPAGVETDLTVRSGTVFTAIGGSGLTGFSDGYSLEGVSTGGSGEVALQVTLTRFTGALYAIYAGSGYGDTVYYIAADKR